MMASLMSLADELRTEPPLTRYKVGEGTDGDGDGNIQDKCRRTNLFAERDGVMQQCDDVRWCDHTDMTDERGRRG